MAKKRRTLLDLFSPGREVTFDDGEGAVTVWLQKINPAENEEAVRRAGAARARLRAGLNDHDSDEYLEMLDDISGYEREVLVNYLTTEREIELRMSVEAELELGDDTEWGKDGYARGLVEAWANGLQDRYVENPDDPEVQHVLKEVQRYNDDVRSRIEADLAGVRASYDDWPIEQLRDSVIEKFTESRLSAEWTKEYERCRIWKATRDPENHRQSYFEHRDEIDQLDDEIREGLLRAYRVMSVDLIEGKGSPGIPASSSSSTTSDTEPEAPASGPDGVSPSTTSPSS